MPASSITWRVNGFDGPDSYCQALDLVRPIAAGGGGFALALNKSKLVDGDLLTTRITIPDYPAHLLVDYLSSDKTVGHVFPTTSDVGDHFYPDQTFPAKSTQTLGEPSGKYEGLLVGFPFGTDMIIVVTSSAQLLPQGNAQSEDAKPYLVKLQDAIEAARKRGARVNAAAVLLETQPKP